MLESELSTERISALVRRIQRYLPRPRQRVYVTTFVEPILEVLPNPQDDLDAYDRHFILTEERDVFYGGNHILNQSDLDQDVLEWVRANCPNSYSTAAISLHNIKSLWFQDPTQRLEDPEGWKGLLKEDS